MATSNLDSRSDNMPHRAAGSGVASVATGDANTITIGGTASNPTVAANLAGTHAWTGVHTWTNAATPVKAIITDGAAAAQLEGMRITHLTSTTATAGIGAYLSLAAESDAGNEHECARIVGLLRTVTDGAENGTLLFQNVQAGAIQNVGHFNSTSFFAVAAIGVGTVNATGVSTTLFQILTASSMWNYNNNQATVGGHLFVGAVNTSGARQFFVITPSANTGSTASTEINKFAYNTYTQTWATGAIGTQREFVINAPTYAFAAASTITTAATFYVSGAPIAGANATITTGHAAWFGAKIRIDAAVALGGGAAPTLGTIGGAGPGAAAQNEWIEIHTNNGPRFVPAWA